jgi:uncharacterized GH25 family protein
MFKLKSLPIALFILALATPALAHDYWAGSKGPDSAGQVTVVIGYGHNFPVGEDLNDEVLSRFQTPKLIGAKGEAPLVSGPELKLFVTKDPPAKGTYLAVVESKPTFGGSTPTGWVRKSKKEDPSITRCSYGANFGKSVVNIGGAADTALATKPLGQKLEIVPLQNPAGLKVNKPFPVKVLFDGKPLPGVQLGAYFGGLTERNNAFAFAANTNKNGEVSIIPLRPGNWLAKVTKIDPYSDQATCDVETYNATLTFDVSE